MAAARDQAARIIRGGSETAQDEAAPEVSAQLADQLRTHVAEETRRRPAESHGTERAAASPAADATAAKPGKRKFVMIGVFGLLALAAIGYGVYFFMVGRFYISTDDAYVRANNTTLGARVAGHVAAILPRDNSVVRAGDVIFRIDDGDYRIAVDAARSRIATQQATIDRIGRQVTALESAAEQAKAQLASADAALKRAGLDFERQQALSTKGFASRATFEVSEASRDQGVAAVKSAQAAYDAARDNVEVTKAQQAEARAQLTELQSQLAKARARSRLYLGSRAGRRHLRQPPRQFRRFHPGRAAARQCRAAQRRLHRRQLQGNPAQADPSRPARRPSRSTLMAIASSPASSTASRRRRARCSRCCRLTTRPATSPRSCSGCRFAFACPRKSPKQNLLRAGMSVYTTVDTREGAADADSEADLDAPGTVQSK